MSDAVAKGMNKEEGSSNDRGFVSSMVSLGTESEASVLSLFPRGNRLGPVSKGEDVLTFLHGRPRRVLPFFGSSVAPSLSASDSLVNINEGS